MFIELPIYKFYETLDKKEYFISLWKELEQKWNSISGQKNNSLDELFTIYMFYLRATKGQRTTSIKGRRKFYETNDYEFLKKEETLENIVQLCHFWIDIYRQNSERFTEEVLKNLFVLPKKVLCYLT